MKTRRSLDFDGLDGILQPQSVDIQSSGVKRLWWLLPILGIVAAIFLLESQTQPTNPNINVTPTPKASVAEPTPSLGDGISTAQATEDDELADKSIEQAKTSTPQVDALASPDEQKIQLIEPIQPQPSPAINQPATQEVLYTINFNLDSSKLSLMTHLEIEAVVNVAKRCPAKINLTGHTCNLGNAHSNDALGLARAKRIRKLLTNNGIDPKRIIALSDGMDNPVATNDTEAGRKLNRRVDLACQDQ